MKTQPPPNPECLRGWQLHPQSKQGISVPRSGLAKNSKQSPGEARHGARQEQMVQQERGRARGVSLHREGGEH